MEYGGTREFPSDVGILAMEIYFPYLFVKQEDLGLWIGYLLILEEIFDKVSPGKYTLGLGQTNMAFTGDREDICSMCLTAVKSLLEKYSIPYDSIGRLEVGTESLIDKSKSVKSVLMQLFQESGNSSIEGIYSFKWPLNSLSTMEFNPKRSLNLLGIDNLNACYGGTAALFNSLNWIESTSWDGRYALVVAGDIAVYAPGPARPTGGCGAIAILIGKNAPLVFDTGLRGIHMEHAYDFYKPVMSSEYPIVDGRFSIECYLRALDLCYKNYRQKFKQKHNDSFTLAKADYVLFHCPYAKLVQKAYARLLFNDFLQDPAKAEFSNLQGFKEIALNQSYTNRELEQAFMQLSSDQFNERVLTTLYLAKELGNIYSGSLYSCLLSLISMVPEEKLLGKRLVLFSYGSGLASTMFSIHVKGSVTSIVQKADIMSRVSNRKKATPEEFTEMLSHREGAYSNGSYKPVDSLDLLWPGTFYLKEVDDLHRRYYEQTPNR